MREEPSGRRLLILTIGTRGLSSNSKSREKKLRKRKKKRTQEN
jgi:hypothetical protein